MSLPADQYDSPWKEALELYLRSILEFCFPSVAQAINWDAGLEFLDKELQEIVRDAALGHQRVDKLVKVQLRDGAEEWILVHVEVQHQPQEDLPRRVYQDHHRIRDRFDRRVLSLVILADDRLNWRPYRYVEEVLGCRVQFDFPVCKLLDLVEAAQEAGAAAQPSAVMVVANWAAQRTGGDMGARREWKWALTRRLYDAGFGRQDVLELYRLIDWLLRLPVELEQAHGEQLRQYEEQKRMRYVTSIERLAREEGQTAGRAKGRVEEGMELVLRQLRRRFGSLAPELEQRIRALTVEQVEGLAEALLDFAGPADLEKWLQSVR